MNLFGSEYWDVGMFVRFGFGSRYKTGFDYFG